MTEPECATYPAYLRRVKSGGTGMKDILVVSHCILNTASKVFQDESELEEEYILRDRLLELAVGKHVQLLQLPCPEFILYGSRRWGHVRDQFMHPHFRRASREMLRPVIDQIEEYSSYPDDYRLIGVVSVEGSPSCGMHLTCRADWRGEIEEKPGPPIMEEGPGVFMEILSEELTDRSIHVPVITIEDATDILEKL
jgi:predicted secreted protein